MAVRLEASVEQAINTVAAFSRDGQVADKIYVGRHPTLGRTGSVVSLTAVWEGAERLADDPAVRCIVLERNPNLLGLEDATLLRIDRVSGGEIERADFIYKKGEISAIEVAKRPLVQTILGNISRLTVQPLSSFPQR